jgi:prefoldin subunit 5
MGLFDIFKKPEIEEPQEQVVMSGPPTDKVVMMRRQGLSNNQIIQTLQQENFDSTAIFDAMNQADLKGGVEMSSQNNIHGGAPSNEGAPKMGGNEGHMPPQQSNPSANPGMGSNSGPNPMGGSPGPMGPPRQAPAMNQGPVGMNADMSSDGPALERIEELAEAIIDEKWNDIVKSINKIADWKERTESKITKMEQQMTDLKKNFDQLHQGVLGKIGDYDKNLMNISTEIKAMDKVFQKVLPVMTENVNELSRITQDMKKK